MEEEIMYEKLVFVFYFGIALYVALMFLAVWLWRKK